MDSALEKCNLKNVGLRAKHNVDKNDNNKKKREKLFNHSENDNSNNE